MANIPTIPPISQAPFVQPQGILTLAANNFLQTLWNAAFGLGGITPGVVLLGYADNVNFNQAGDTPIILALPSGAIGWRSNSGMIFGLQGSFSHAQAGLWTQPFASGTPIVSPAALSSITAVGFNAASAVAGFTPRQDVIWNHNTTLYLNVNVAQGGTAWGNFYLYGYPVF